MTILQEPDTNTISGNTGNGLYLESSSTANVFGGLTISGNTKDGVHLETGSGIRFQYPYAPAGGTLPPPNNISGDTGSVGVNCTDTISWAAGDTTGVAKPVKCNVYPSGAPEGPGCRRCLHLHQSVER